jgi:hypothetical protein
MKLARAKRMIFVLAAVLSLAGANIAACACDHHQIGPVTAPAEASCHGVAHSDTQNTQVPGDEPLDDRAGTGCNCFVRDPGPSFFANARNLFEGSDAATDLAVDVVSIRVTGRWRTSPANFHSNAARYEFLQCTRAPARAPPRL